LGARGRSTGGSGGYQPEHRLGPIHVLLGEHLDVRSVIEARQWERKTHNLVHYKGNLVLLVSLASGTARQRPKACSTISNPQVGYLKCHVGGP
jgi:hypothetical protein